MTPEEIIANEKYHTCSRCKWGEFPFICHQCKWGEDVRKDLWELKDGSESGMTNEEAIIVLELLLQKLKPVRADGKSTTHTLQTMALGMAIQALGQQPCEDVLDKIRAEIEEHAKINQNLNVDRARTLCWCLDVIDKYKTESEVKDE